MALAERKIGMPEKEDSYPRDQLISKYLPHVKRIVYRIAIHIPSSVEIDDLISAGVIGLIEAVERYDPDRDNKFLTYAAFRIRGAVLSELRSRDFLSRSNRRKSRELQRACMRLEQVLGREPEDEEVAEELGLDLDGFYQVKRLASISFISLKDVGNGSREEKESLLGWCLENNESKDAATLAGLKEMEIAVARAIKQLPEREKLVVSLYYWEELTMKEIGLVLNVTESRVSQIHSQAVIRLRARLKKEGLVED